MIFLLTPIWHVFGGLEASGGGCGYSQGLCGPPQVISRPVENYVFLASGYAPPLSTIQEGVINNYSSIWEITLLIQISALDVMHYIINYNCVR